MGAWQSCPGALARGAPWLLAHRSLLCGKSAATGPMPTCRRRAGCWTRWPRPSTASGAKSSESCGALLLQLASKALCCNECSADVPRLCSTALGAACASTPVLHSRDHRQVVHLPLHACQRDRTTEVDRLKAETASSAATRTGKCWALQLLLPSLHVLLPLLLLLLSSRLPRLPLPPPPLLLPCWQGRRPCSSMLPTAHCCSVGRGSGAGGSGA